MKFTEKNDFLVKHTSEEHFSKDRELFKTHCPNSRLHADLKRANSFNRKKLDGLMLYELLDKVSPEEILNNRSTETPEDNSSNLNSVEEVKTLFEGTSIDMDDFPDETLSVFIGLKKEDITPFVEFIDSIYALAPESIETIDKVKAIIEESGIPISGTIEELALLLIGKTKEDILNMLTFAEVYYSTFPKKENESDTINSIPDEKVPSEISAVSNPSEEDTPDELPLNQELEEKEKELDEKEEELTDKELELEEKEESLEEKAQELEDKEKELSEKEAELEKTSAKKKEANKKSSRK